MDYTNRKNHLSQTFVLALVSCGFAEKPYFYLKNAKGEAQVSHEVSELQ